MARNRKVVADDALTPPLVVLRKIDLKQIDRKSFALIRDTMVRHQGAMYTPLGVTGNSISEGELPWFADGYVLNDHPRMFDLTKEIMNSTIGFAVARSDSGEILAEFGANGLKDAIAAVKGATVQLLVDVTIPTRSRSRKAAAESS